MGLELKELSPYLPYGLQIKILNHKCDYVGIEYAKVNGFYFIGDSLHLTYEGGSTGKDVSLFKPILRPISDLTDEMAINCGYKNANCLRLMIISQKIPYIGIINLFKYHYDVFLLINTGLAIDINTIEDASQD